MLRDLRGGAAIPLWPTGGCPFHLGGGYRRAADDPLQRQVTGSPCRAAEWGGVRQCGRPFGRSNEGSGVRSRRYRRRGLRPLPPPPSHPDEVEREGL